MKIWIDLANSPHVPFFSSLQKEFLSRGHQVEITARDFAETVALAEQAQLSAEVIGGYGGRKVSGKAVNLLSRAWDLGRWARVRNFGLAVSHNSYSQIVAARMLRIPCVTLMDYEYQPANHVAFRFSNKIIVPDSFPVNQLKKYGAHVGKVRRYHGTKEDVYLADFQPSVDFDSQLAEYGITFTDVLVTMRPPASNALYHQFENSLFDEMLQKALASPQVKVILLPRDDAQRGEYSKRINKDLIVPDRPLPGPDLIAASDLVISAGGTINREAAALGVPAASIYAGEWAAIDQMLVEEGRLVRIRSGKDIESLNIAKKSRSNARRALSVRREIVKLILDDDV